jgi:NADH:ubiquinone oxidoreductase subunit 5 (subunit L)/multisubunit Na+/H+ antiporter MnhA subunit
MPATGTLFLLGAAAISGLPPLNGFVSELLIYLGALDGLAGGVQVAAGAVVIGSLALIGGLAAACFTKVGGIVFLGEPRTPEAQNAREASPWMWVPMGILAAGCVAIGLAGWLMPGVLAPAVRELVPAALAPEVDRGLALGGATLAAVSAAGAALLGLIGLLALGRARLLAGRQVDEAGTWDCGYAAPSPRMQYTASSFAEPIRAFFGIFLQSHDEIHPPRGLFPDHAGLHTDSPDVFRRWIFAPLFAAARWLALKSHWLQYGRVQLYVLYIAITLLVLLVWKLG